MAVIIGVLVGLAGLALLVIGLGFFLAFRLALRHFDRALKTEFAGQTREQIERAAMKIGNPIVRNFVLKYLVQGGTTVTVAMVRSGLESRMRTGLYMALGGAALLVASFMTHLWLPAIIGSQRRQMFAAVFTSLLAISFWLIWSRIAWRAIRTGRLLSVGAIYDRASMPGTFWAAIIGMSVLGLALTALALILVDRAM